MMLVGADPGSIGESDDDRDLGIAPGAEPKSAQMAHDLVEGRIHETVELDLGYRSRPGQCHTHGRPDDARLVERCVDDPVLAETLLETLGDPEDPAGQTDIFAEDDDTRIALHRFVERGVDRLGHGQRPCRPVENGVLTDRPDLIRVEMSRRLVM